MEKSESLKVASLEVLNGELAGTSFPLQGDVLIGRKKEGQESAGDHIALSDSQVSRQHARIARQGEHYVIEDLGSTNGTLLNSIPLTPKKPYLLREGSNLQLGGVHMRFRPAASEKGKKFNIPWRSEIGFNEAVFDLSLIANESSVGRQSSHASMILTDSALIKPSLSMAIDAREVLKNLNRNFSEEGGDGSETAEDVQRRLRALAQVSLSLGGQENSEALLAKVMDFIFDIFPAAEHAYALLCSGAEAGKESLNPVVAMSRNEGRVKVTLSRAIVNEVISKQQAILSSDAQSDGQFDSHESIIGLNIRSVMCAPLLVDEEVLGLIQVDTCNTHSFDKEDLEILAGIGAQAAVVLKNIGLAEDIKQLFEGFVKASVHAIEARDPATAGHSFRVAGYCRSLAEAVEKTNVPNYRDVRFTREQMDELRYAALLHDFGKVGVREHVLIKSDKLYPRQMDVMEQRFKLACASIERKAYRELLDQQENEQLSVEEFRARRQRVELYLAQEKQRVWNFMKPIKHANQPSVSHQTVSQALQEALQEAVDYRFPGDDGETISLLSEYEMDALSMAQGSLTPSERREIESHVSHTYAFLQHIPWTKGLSAVPNIAYSHHERLDGSGYPRGLNSEQIPLRARIMMISDIFDALVAGDRPYKSSVQEELALDILRAEAEKGKLDVDLVSIFIESESFRLQLGP